MESVFIHPLADVQSKQIGRGTRIWQFAVVLRGAQIGEDCNICAQTFIENDVVIGNHVTIKCGVQLWDGVRVGDYAFLGPNVTFTNDKCPDCTKDSWALLETVVEERVSIGANATILPGVRLGRGCIVGAGAVVTKDVPPGAVVVGNPAREVSRKQSATLQDRVLRIGYRQSGSAANATQGGS